MFYIPFPSWLKPVIIPGLPLHWYGLMYLIAFGITYVLFRYQVKKENIAIEEDDITNFFFWTILGLIIGARVFSSLVYDRSGLYWHKPWLIFWPFDENMRLVGLQGMSYHGGLIGAVIGASLYSFKRKLNFLKFVDLAVAGIPLGYTFGRLGNFINGELWGRVTTVSWGVLFPHAPRFSTQYEWVRSVADKVGIKYSPGDTVNLPRHPSQLYEAFFEGIFLWAVLWFFFRKRKKFDGYLLSVYLIGYGIIRFFIEYFREPDIDMGFPIHFGAEVYPSSLLLSYFNFTTGQILCVLMIISGIVLYSILKKRSLR